MTAPCLEADAQDRYFMAMALEQASLAEAAGEVPVGAVLVHGRDVIAQAHNRVIGLHDPTAHAEVLALRAGGLLRQNYRLPGLTLFITLEPCAMCAMAMMHARLSRVVFATPDPKTGAAGSVLDLFSQRQLNHHTSCVGGVMAEQASEQLKRFFASRRRRSSATPEGEHHGN